MIHQYFSMKNVGILFLLFLIQTNLHASPYQAGVALTFDDYYVDGWYDYFLQRADANDPNGAKATFFTSHWRDSYAYYPPGQVNKLKALEVKGHEIGYHTYDHKGVGSDYQYDPNKIPQYISEQIIPGRDKMIAHGFNPVSFAYPFGETSDAYNTAVRAYFPYLRETHSDNSKQLFEIDELYHNEAKTYDILAGDGTDNIYANNIAEIEQALIRAKNNNEILTLYSHEIVADSSPDAGYDFAIRMSKLDQIINKAKQLGLKFYTFKDAYQAGNHGAVTTTLTPNTVDVNWTGISCDFIGVVPANQNQWQTGMPSIITNGSSAGAAQINVPNPLNAVQYKLIFYKNNNKVFSSNAFVMLNLTSAPLPPEIVSPKGVSSRENGSVLLKWNAVPGAENYDFEGYKTNANGNAAQLIFNQSATIAEAGCANGSGICHISVPVSASVQYGIWSIRANFNNLDSDYSDNTSFSLVDGPITDTTPPVISLAGVNPVNILIGTSYVDAGATATDNIDPSVTVSINTSQVNTAVAGSYNVQFSATDTANNTATTTRTVIVSQTTQLTIPVIISPKGVTTHQANAVIFKWNSVPQAISYDYNGYETDASENINWNHLIVNKNITAEAAGCALGGVCQVTETILVQFGVWSIRGNSNQSSSQYSEYTAFSLEPATDSTPPVITLQGSSPVSIEKGSVYTDAGATATDNIDTTVSVITNTTAINTAIAGSYQVVFTATDSANNTATAYRDVNVIETVTLPPSIFAPIGSTNTRNNVVNLSWSHVQGATQYDYKIFKTINGVTELQPVISKTISAQVAGCIQGICRTTETLTIKQGAWSIRTHKGVVTSEYSPDSYFTLKESNTTTNNNAAVLVPIIQMLLLD